MSKLFNIFYLLTFLFSPLAYSEENKVINCSSYNLVGDEYSNSIKRITPEKVFHKDGLETLASEVECKEKNHSIYYCLDNQSQISDFVFSALSVPFISSMKMTITSSDTEKKYEWSSKRYYHDFINNVPSLSFSLPKGKSLIKIETDSITITPTFNLSSETKMIEGLSWNAAAGFSYIGILFVILFYNMVLFYKTRQKDFLYISLFTIFILMLTTASSGWMGAIISAMGIIVSTEIVSCIASLSTTAATLSLMLFIESYLDMDKHLYFVKLKKLNLILKAILMLVPVSYFLLFFGIGSISACNNLCLTIGGISWPIFVVVNMYTGFKNKNKFIYNLALGILTLFVFSIIGLSLQYYQTDSTFLTKYSVNLGVFFQLMLLSAAIGEKLKQYNESVKEQILSLNHELLSANQTLEARIEEKARYHTIVLSSIDEGIFCYSLSSIGELEVIPDTVSHYLKDQIGLNGNEKILLSDMLFSLNFSAEDIKIISLNSREVFYGKKSSSLVPEIFPSEKSVSHHQETKFFEVLSTPVIEDDKVNKIMVCLRDITKAKKQRTFLKDILEYSSKIQKLDTIDEVVSSVASHLHEIFPLHKISMLLIEHRNTNVINAEHYGFSDLEQKRIIKFHMDDSLIRFLKESSSLFSFLKSTGDTEGKKSFLKLFMQGEEIEENEKYILSIFLDQVIELIKVKMQSIALEKYANADALTGTFNRGYLDKMLSFYKNRSLKPEHPFTVIYCDVNGLKRINDNYSHGAGDTLIKEAAQIIKNSTRDTDLIFRYGGDEFVVICPNILKDGGEVIRERIMSKCQDNPYSLMGADGKEVTEHVGLSIGIADNLDGEDLLNVADKRMILDKEEFYKTHTKYR